MLCKKLCEIKEGVWTHFATLEKFRKPCAKSKNLCENQWSLKSLFKPLQALFSFRTPHLPIVKASITLRRPSFHSFSLLDALRPLIWRHDPHQTYGTQTRASHSISDMTRIRGGHTDSSLSCNPRPRASSPQDSTTQALEASTIPSSEGGVPSNPSQRRYETRIPLTTPEVTSSRPESSVRCTPAKKARTSGLGESSRPS